MNVTALMIYGALAGTVFGLIFGTRPIGWLSLLLVPLGAIFYINWWQAQHPENLRSTSALDYIFITPIPLASALVMYGAIFFTRMWLETRQR
ncbi:hypothetical protein [Blastomonas sp.]|uniref:hypothetical protein n=1 Tax=Blastomonas sp. TaxID=1909299 RepID=UPI00391C3BC2